MNLNQLRDNPFSKKEKIRVGRGIGSGKGKTGGRGVKGQKSRTGVSINGFEGGQMPLFRRLPKRGFKNINRKEYEVFNLSDLQRAIDAKIIDASKLINAEVLSAAGLVRSASSGVKLLAVGKLQAKVQLEVSRASEAAVEGVRKAGGSLTILEPSS